MKRVIHKLRQHPEHIRRKILYVATIASFFLLLGLWSLSINATINATNIQASIAGDLKPFQMLKTSIIDSTDKLAWPFNKPTTVNNTTDTTIVAPTVTPDTNTSTITTDTLIVTPDSTNTGDSTMYTSDSTNTTQ